MVSFSASHVNNDDDDEDDDDDDDEDGSGSTAMRHKNSNNTANAATCPVEKDYRNGAGGRPADPYMVQLVPPQPYYSNYGPQQAYLQQPPDKVPQRQAQQPQHAQHAQASQQQQQQQIPPPPPWLPYGVPIYSEMKGSYPTPYHPQQALDAASAAKRDHITTVTADGSKVLGHPPTVGSMPYASGLKSDTDSQFKPQVNSRSSNGQPHMNGVRNNPMASPYMYQYQYPYYMQDSQQHSSMPGPPPLPHQQSSSSSVPPLPAPLSQHPLHSLGQVQLPLQSPYQYQYQYQHQPYFPSHTYIMPQPQLYPNYPHTSYQNSQSNGKVQHAPGNERRVKYIDFEDKNSIHYLKKKIDKGSGSMISSSTGSAVSVPNEEHGTGKITEVFQVEARGGPHYVNDSTKDSDTWSVPLSYNDSVSMIESKRRRQAEMKYENKFKAINESDLSVDKNGKRLSGKDHYADFSKSNDSASNGDVTRKGDITVSNNHKYTSKSSNPNSHSDSFDSHQNKGLSDYSVTDVSTTKRWIDEQSNEMKRTALANEHEMRELKKRQKKYQPLKLDVKCPKYLNPSLLEASGLPDYQTLYKLVGVYYKYLNMHTLILPNMSYFLDNLYLCDDSVALLASIFKMSAKYISHNEVDNVWLDESHWEKVYSDREDKITTNCAILCTLIQCTRGEDDCVNSCIERASFANLDLTLSGMPWNELEQLKANNSISSVALLEREIMIRAYWCAYRNQLFRRLSFGYPYSKGEGDAALKLNKNIELPLSDVKYYKESETLYDFKKMYYKKLSLSSISTTYPDGSKLFDSACVIVSLLLLEEVLDSISNQTLFSYTIMRFSHRLNKNFQIHDKFKHLQPYQLETHPKKEPHIIINSSNFTSTLVNRTTCLVLSIALCEKLLVYPAKSIKPFRSQINPFNDLSLVEVEPDLIVKKSEEIADPEEKLQNWVWFFKAIDVSYDMLLLLELGDGVCSATLGDTSLNEVFETVIGPCCAGSSVVEEWCKFNTWTMNVSNVPVENQGWIQMPFVTVWAVVQAWSFLSSLALSLKVLDFVCEESPEPVDSNDVTDATDATNEDRYGLNLSENEDEERIQVTGDAGRIDSEADFKKKVKRDNCNVGSASKIENFDEFRGKTVTIVEKATGKTVVSGITFESAPVILNLILKSKARAKSDKKDEIMNMILEKMKLVRKYLGIMERYNGDCKVAGVYCDKVLNYIIKLANDAD